MTMIWLVGIGQPAKDQKSLSILSTYKYEFLETPWDYEYIAHKRYI